MRKVLIFDNELDSIAIFKLLLKDQNYEIHAITDSTRALETIFWIQPELIILDWITSKKDGVTVIQQIRERPEFNEIPIIVITSAHTSIEDLRYALENGALDYLTKPINEIELIARIAKAFRLIDLHREILFQKMDLQNKKLEVLDARNAFLKEELEKKEREMTMAGVNIFQNKNILTNIRKDLLEKSITFNHDQRENVNAILKKYDNVVNTINWQLIEKRFIEIHSDFYRQLKKDFPTLTCGELRLCAFLRIGFSTKELSVLTISSYESMRKSLYRIRKKLMLAETTNLNIFLLKY